MAVNTFPHMSLRLEMRGKKNVWREYKEVINTVQYSTLAAPAGESRRTTRHFLSVQGGGVKKNKKTKTRTEPLVPINKLSRGFFPLGLVNTVRWFKHASQKNISKTLKRVARLGFLNKVFFQQKKVTTAHKK